MSERIWDNYKLRNRVSTGFAARRNRGSYTGTKLHQIMVEEIIDVIDKEKENARPGPTLGKRFIMHGKPVQFSAYPLCGCTQGQNAARESVGFTGIQKCMKCFSDPQ